MQRAVAQQPSELILHDNGEDDAGLVHARPSAPRAKSLLSTVPRDDGVIVTADAELVRADKDDAELVHVHPSAPGVDSFVSTVPLNGSVIVSAENALRSFAETHRHKLLCAIIVLGICILTYAKRQVDAYEASTTIYAPPWHADSGVLVRVVGSVLACWFLAGLASFCLFMRFTDASRHLTLCEAFYLCMQILTTVGYGDFTPTTANGMAFMTVYLIVGVCVVAALIGELLAWFVQQQQGKLRLGSILKRGIETPSSKLKSLRRAGSKAFEKGRTKLSSRESVASDKGAEEDGEGAREEIQGARSSETRTSSVEEEDCCCAEGDCKDHRAADWGRIGSVFFPLLVVYVVGVAFFYLWPGEGKSLGEAIYLCTMTMTTTGFGAYHPVTQAGYAFASVWMFLSVWCMGRLIKTICEIVFRRRRQATNTSVAHALLDCLQSSGRKAVSQEEFLRLELIRSGLVKAKDIDRIDRQFQTLDSNNDGLLDLGDLDFWRSNGADAPGSTVSKLRSNGPSVILEAAEDEHCASAGS